MVYVDYKFDLNENIIMFDKDLKLCGQINGNNWGNLPETWKEGDLWRTMISANGDVCMMRVKDSASNS
jgi:hypothetical protein